MKKLLSLMAILLFPCMAFAGYESLTVSSAAVGLASAPTGYGGNQASCVLTLEIAPIRFRMDGTAPTTLVGHIMAPGATLKLQGEQIAKFRAIQLNAVDATIRATCNDTGAAMLDNTDLSYTRTPVNYYAVAAAAGTTTTETLITMTRSSAVSATTTSTAFVIPVGKKYRITHLSVATRGHATATIQTTTFNFRLDATGPGITTASTPVVFSARSATPATSSAWDRYNIPIPEGYEIAGNGVMAFGITAAATFTTNAPSWDLTLLGYEY